MDSEQASWSLGRILVSKLTSIISVPLNIKGAKLLDFARIASHIGFVPYLTSPPKHRTDDARKKWPISHEY
uniref:Uncharacterized protein n=1 Tax=Moniliophthora roreri TaxID=221103 RepID=A0A0W0GA58_MONRR